jgi:hypothetical protein
MPNDPGAFGIAPGAQQAKTAHKPDHAEEQKPDLDQKGPKVERPHKADHDKAGRHQLVIGII